MATLTHVPDDTSRRPRRLAAALTGLQALVLAGFAAFYVYELAVGEGSDATRVIMSAVLILVGAVGLGALAKGWLGDSAWPKTLTIVWSALLVPVAIGLIQGNQSSWAGPSSPSPWSPVERPSSRPPPRTAFPASTPTPDVGAR